MIYLLNFAELFATMSQFILANWAVRMYTKVRELFILLLKMYKISKKIVENGKINFLQSVLTINRT